MLEASLSTDSREEENKDSSKRSRVEYNIRYMHVLNMLNLNPIDVFMLRDNFHNIGEICTEDDKEVMPSTLLKILKDSRPNFFKLSYVELRLVDKSQVSTDYKPGESFIVYAKKHS